MPRKLAIVTGGARGARRSASGVGEGCRASLDRGDERRGTCDIL